MKSLNITWDDELHKKVKSIAAARGVTLGGFIESLVRAYVTHHEPKATCEAKG